MSSRSECEEGIEADLAMPLSPLDENSAVEAEKTNPNPISKEVKHEPGKDMFLYLHFKLQITESCSLVDGGNLYDIYISQKCFI